MSDGPPKDVLANRPGSGLAEFAHAAAQLGAVGLHYEILPDQTETISQTLGEGWHGLGWDGNNVWMGLTATGEGYGWNANTLLRDGEEYMAIVPGQSGQLTADHPIARMFAKIKGKGAAEIHITGVHAGWQLAEQTRLAPDEEGNLVGNIPKGVEIKAVITNVGQIADVKWNDGNWQSQTIQTFSVKMKE